MSPPPWTKNRTGSGVPGEASAGAQTSSVRQSSLPTGFWVASSWRQHRAVGGRVERPLPARVRLRRPEAQRADRRGSVGDTAIDPGGAALRALDRAAIGDDDAGRGLDVDRARRGAAGARGGGAGGRAGAAGDWGAAPRQGERKERYAHATERRCGQATVSGETRKNRVQEYHRAREACKVRASAGARRVSVTVPQTRKIAVPHVKPAPNTLDKTRSPFLTVPALRW